MERIRLRGLLMKESKEKEHRISNLKDMIDNVKEEEEVVNQEELEEDSELIDYLNEDPINFDDLEIDNEFIYHPGDEDAHAIDLDEDHIDEDFIIKTPKTKDIDDEEIQDIDEFADDIVGEISENFDNVLNARIRGKPILAIFSTILGIILLIISVFIFQSRADRVVDNVVAGETSFMFIIFLVVGFLLLAYGIYKLIGSKNPFERFASSIDSIDKDEDKDDEKPAETQPEKPSPKVIPKSEIPLDKESYKIGEFNMDDIKTSLKKPATSTKKKVLPKEDVDDIPPAKEKAVEKAEPTEEEIENIEYEQVQLETESIDDIFAEVEDIDDLPIISIDSKEKDE